MGDGPHVDMPVHERLEEVAEEEGRMRQLSDIGGTKGPDVEVSLEYSFQHIKRHCYCKL